MPRAKAPEPSPIIEPGHSAAPDAAGIFAGTSGWAYPTWKPGFYPPKLPAKKFLGFYASQVNSVEVNFTFRKLPSETMLEGWLAQTGAGFRFSFKAPQRITHFNRLRDCAEPVADFLAALHPAARAGKLGLLLFQLPPNFKADAERLQAFLSLPPLRNPAAPPLAFEFRHESWFSEEVYAVLREHNAALCVADTDELQTPEIHTAGKHTCFRLRRQGGYSDRELEQFASSFRAVAAEREVYAYFRHEDEPAGALNATAFLRLAVEQASEQEALG